MSDNNIEIQFHKKEPKTLEVLSLQLAGAILPFVYYFEKELEDKDFETFTQYATTNSNIYFDFARFISKNYIFITNSEDPRGNCIYQKHFSSQKEKIYKTRIRFAVRRVILKYL